jgi:uridylate kinase
MGKTGYGRVLLKVSGESLSGEGGFGIDPGEIRSIAGEIAAACEGGARVAIVVGGGNIVRGGALAAEGLVHRAAADWMGMLGTVINAIALADAIDALGRPARCLTAVEIQGAGDPYSRARADELLDAGVVVVLGGGIGNPFVTTDTTAAIRARELGCDAVLKATKVDGVYSADPKTDPSAQRFNELTLAEAIERRLAVMDLGALTMCEEGGVEIVVFDYAVPGAIARAVAGQSDGTRVRP